VGKIAEKADCRSDNMTIWHCIWSAELIKTHFFRLFFCRFYPLGKACSGNIEYFYFLAVARLYWLRYY